MVQHAPTLDAELVSWERPDLQTLRTRFADFNTSTLTQLSVRDALEFALVGRSVRRRTVPAGRAVAKGWASSAFGPVKDPMTGRPAFREELDFARRCKSPVLVVADGIVSQAGR